MRPLRTSPHGHSSNGSAFSTRALPARRFATRGKFVMRQSMACSRMSAAGWAGSNRRYRRPRISSEACKGGGGSSGGGGGGGQSVDPVALANAQGQANVSSAETQAQLNASNTFSPYGSTVYAPNQIDPTTGKPSSYNITQS